jgi:hypothetical protein
MNAINQHIYNVRKLDIIDGRNSPFVIANEAGFDLTKSTIGVVGSPDGAYYVLVDSA